MNASLSIVFIALYKLNNPKINIEVIIGSLLILWSIMDSTIFTKTLLDYSLMIVYGSMLLLKQIRKRSNKIIIISAIVLLSMMGFIVSKQQIVELCKSLMLISVMSLVHYNIYYNSYKEKPDIKAKYKLTDQEFKLINIFLDLCQTDPSNKAIAEKMFISESHIKALLNSIYEKFDIQKGGNKKTVLIFKLRDF